jgi:AAA ATPase-like protein
MSSVPSDAAQLDDFFERVSVSNPFLDNRINNPSARDVDVAEIHQTAFTRLTGLAREALAARRGVGVVLWGEAGVGKSHVLSRLARWAAEEGRADFVYLHNLQAAPERLPRALLRTVVNVLTCGQVRRLQTTPLGELVRGGLVGIVDGVSKWPSWEALHQAYNQRLDRLGAADLPGAALLDREVFEVLFCFYRSVHEAMHHREDGATAALAVRWLSGEALEPEEAVRLGLRPGSAGETADPQQIKQVLVALSRLAAAAGRPFVLAFDQVDNLDDEQFAALGRFLEALIDAAPNLLAVTAGIQSSLLRWKESGVIQKSAWDRLAQFEVHLLRLTAAEGLRLIQSRLRGFLAPFADREPIRRRLEADPLFPLGEEWRRRNLQDKVDLRPRDVLNGAREGWRMQQEALGQRGGPAWLAGWKGAAGGDNGAALTEAEMQAAIDRAVAEIVEVRAAAIRADPTQAPPEAERTADLVYTLLAQCRERAGAASVRRMPPPRRGARPSYDLEIVHAAPADGTPLRTGVLFLTAVSANSATGFLRRLAEDSQPLQRLFLATDERVQLPLGERGAELLKKLQEQPGLRFEQRELTVAELAEMDALQEAVRLARGGDLEAEIQPGRMVRVTERDVIESHHRRGRYMASRLLHELLTPPAAVPRTSLQASHTISGRVE